MRFSAHVGQEILERMHPSFADFDASAAIIQVIGLFGIMAATLHILPSLVFLRMYHAMLIACILLPLGIFAPWIIQDFRATAAAAFGMSLPQFVSGDYYDISATALTNPARLPVRTVLSSGDYCQLSELLPDQIGGL